MLAEVDRFDAGSGLEAMGTAGIYDVGGLGVARDDVVNTLRWSTGVCVLSRVGLVVYHSVVLRKPTGGVEPPYHDEVVECFH